MSIDWEIVLFGSVQSIALKKDLLHSLGKIEAVSKHVSFFSAFEWRVSSSNICCITCWNTLWRFFTSLQLHLFFKEPRIVSFWFAHFKKAARSTLSQSFNKCDPLCCTQCPGWWATHVALCGAWFLFSSHTDNVIEKKHLLYSYTRGIF